MSILLTRLLRPYMAPAGDADGGGGTTIEDRGDHFVPTDDDAPPPAPAPAPAPAPKEPAAASPADEPDLDPEDPDGDPSAEDQPKKKDSRIPLSRHKDILAKERAAREAAEARLAQFEKGKQVASINEDITKLENDVLSLEKQYTKLLADGEIDKATEMMRQIRATERQINEAKNDYKLQVSIAQATEQARYNVALERVEEAYPVLNPDHDEFDKAVLSEVVEWKVFYETQRNATPTKALQDAVRKVLGKTDNPAQERATTVTPRVDQKDVAAERKKAAVAKAVDAANKTPANFAKAGLDSDKAGGSLTAKDVMKMSQEDFRKLPDDVLARMRGDEFV